MSGGGRRVRRTRTVAFAKRASPAARSRLAKPLATAGNSFGIGGASSALVYCHAILKRGADQVALSVKEKHNGLVLWRKYFKTGDYMLRLYRDVIIQDGSESRLDKKIGPFVLRQQNNLWKMKVEYNLSNKLDDNNKLFCINLKW